MLAKSALEGENMKKENKTPFLRSGLAFASALLLLSGCGTQDNPAPSSSETKTSSSVKSEEASSSASSKQESSKENELPSSSESGVSSIPHVHTFEEGWRFDETHHWHAATCGHETEKSSYAPHDFDEGTITKAPTYEEEGIEAFTCATCKMIKTVAVPTLVGFFMPVQDCFTITSKGLVLTGIIESGKVKVNDVLSLSGTSKKVTIKSIEKYKKTYESAEKGDEVGLLVEGVAKSEVARGSALFTPDSKSYHNQIKVRLTSLTQEEGGLRTPFFSKYSPVVKYYPCASGEAKGYLGEVKGCVILPEDLEMFNPGKPMK